LQLRRVLVEKGEANPNYLIRMHPRSGWFFNFRLQGSDVQQTDGHGPMGYWLLSTQKLG